MEAYLFTALGLVVLAFLWIARESGSGAVSMLAGFLMVLLGISLAADGLDFKTGTAEYLNATNYTITADIYTTKQSAGTTGIWGSFLIGIGVIVLSPLFTKR